MAVITELMCWTTHTHTQDDHTQFALVDLLFLQFSAAVVRHKANGSVAYAI